MAESILAFGVEKLWDILVRESEPRQGVDEQLAELKRAINLLSSFLKDADAKKHRSARVGNYVEEIKEIIYDWEDTVETFLLRQNLGQTNGSKMSIETLAFATTIYDGEDTLETLFLSQNLKSGSKKSIKKLAFDVAGISKRISKVIREMQSFGIQQIITDGWNMQPLRDRQREMRQTFPQDYESDFVGLEADVKRLVRCLVEEDNVQMVSITGMGGLGKTTLARQVFNHEDVQCQFDGLSWVCVSREFTRMNVWQKILVDLKPKEEKNILEMTESTLQDELFRLLETSKSLIVFDDIWREEDWDRIKSIFPPKKGWKVLLTSRNDCVVGYTIDIQLKPECLNTKDSWTLFQRIAFPIKDASEFKIDEEMEEMGKQMIKHCGGLPLAIKVLGGFLAEKYTVHDWKRLSENIASHLMGGRNDSLENVLSLSFEELPIYLKNCFLYLAHFPEDHSIDVEALSYYWAAEGLFESRHYDEETICNVGDICIEELVKRNMVISEREATTLRFETCHLHVMMREICLLKAKEENFLQIISSHPPTADFESLVTSRRFVSHYPTTLDVERDIDNPKIRSLVVVSHHLWGNWKLSGSSFKRLELLRTLDLFKGEFQGEELPYSIGELIHLRFLSLKDVKVIHLPSSLGNLKLLIYLNIKVHMESIFVPNVLMGMQELRYLALPYDMHEKTKLELSSLVKLETLKNFTTENSSVKDLRGMVRLKTLTLKLTDETSIETLSPSIGGLRHLEDLRIQDNRRRRTKEEGLVWDFVHLKKLKLKIYMPILLKEELLPSQLTSLDLFGCRLKEDPMPILEKLLHLYEVKLGDQSLCGRRMVCSNGGFPILQRLEFSGLQEWEEWIVEEGSMPLLHTLHIWDCPKLKKVPDRLRLYEFKESIVEEGSMPLLHTLHIQDCPKLKEVLDGIRFICSLKNQSIETNRLDLREYRLEDDPMPILEKMFHLYDVELGDQSFCGRRMVCSSGGFPKLQRLTFNGLEEWEEWIVEEGSMPLLQSLEIWECPKLKDFPNGLHFPSHLITIYLNNCALEEDPMPILEKLVQLKELYLSQCFNGRRMVCSGGGFPQLHNLRLFELRELEKWIVEEGSMPLLHTLEIGWCPKLKELPDGQHFPSHLTTIYLCSCGLEEDPFPILEKLVQLKEVRVSKCLSGRILVCSASGFPQLEKLYVDELEELEEWIVEEGSMPLLRSLNISNCPELKELPDGQHFPSHLTTISLSLCGLEEDPMPILEKLVQLEEVKLSQCFTGKRMVCSGGGFPQLQKLKLYGLDEWEVWIVEKGSMPLLHILEIWGCPKVKELPDGLQFPSHLTTISLSWCGLEEDPMPILEKLVQLKEVILSKCFSGRKMVCSPHGFPQLQKLCLDELEELEEWIVEEGSMPLLQYLDITKCPNVSVAGSVDFLNFLSTSFQSARFEDVFSSISSSPAKHRKQNSSPFDDLVGNNLRKRENKHSSVFDDLIPGFGRTSSPPPKRSTSETSQSQKPPNQTAKTPSNLVEEDPFVVLEESPLTPREPSTGGFTDPLEEIGKFNSRKTDHSSVHGGESSGSYHSKKVSFDDVLEPQNTSAPPPTNSDGSFESSDDVWLTLSEIPLFTQPTSTPPPARPPPPRPTRPVKKKVNEPSIPSSANHSHVPSSARASANCPTASQMDELDDFSMGRNQTAANGYPDPPSGEDSDVTSAAVASAAAMKDAMDKAEAKFRHAKERREKENLKASRSREGDHTENYDSRERELREKQVRLDRERVEKEAEIEKAQEREREERQREQKIIERERERLLARQAVERATREACERAATEAHAKVQRAAVGKATDARERAVRAAVQRAHAEARERAAAGAREKAEKAAAEARERANAEALEKEAKVRAERAAEARGRASAQAKAKQQQENNNDLDSFFNSVSRPSSAPQQRTNPPDPFQDSWNKGGSFESSRASSPVPSGASENLRKPTSAKNIVDDLSSLFGASASQSGGFQDVGGETEQRRRARLGRHQRTQERAAKALADKNERDLQLQREQAEKDRIGVTLDVEIKRWGAGKEGNLRALLSTLQYVLWPECGWQPVSLTDLIAAASVKKVYRKATLCIHPDKVQQKGANLQQKYIAEKVFDMLKEALNKFNSEELL